MSCQCISVMHLWSLAKSLSGIQGSVYLLWLLVHCVKKNAVKCVYNNVKSTLFLKRHSKRFNLTHCEWDVSIYNATLPLNKRFQNVLKTFSMFYLRNRVNMHAELTAVSPKPNQLYQNKVMINFIILV